MSLHCKYHENAIYTLYVCTHTTLYCCRRMKMDLIENEEAKLSQLQEDQFSELDQRLKQVLCSNAMLHLLQYLSAPATIWVARYALGTVYNLYI